MSKMPPLRSSVLAVSGRQPYSAGSSGTQFYVIDGFILSPNVEPVSVRTQDAEFAVTDHNPVVLEARLVS